MADRFIHGMSEYFSVARAKAKTFLRDTEKDKQEGVQGQMPTRVSCQKKCWNKLKVVRTPTARQE